MLPAHNIFKTKQVTMENPEGADLLTRMVQRSAGNTAPWQADMVYEHPSSVSKNGKYWFTNLASEGDLVAAGIDPETDGGSNWTSRNPISGLGGSNSGLVRQAVTTYGEGLVTEAVSTKSNAFMEYTGTGVTGLAVYTGFPLATAEYGGLLLGCAPSVKGDRAVIDHIRGSDSYMLSSSTAAAASVPDMITSFASDGFFAAAQDRFNSAAGNSLLAFQTTQKIDPVVIKSLKIDITDNWGRSDTVGIRQVDFLNSNGDIQTVLPADFTAYTSSEYGTTFEVEEAFNSSRSRTGAWVDQQWLSGLDQPTNQCITIVFDTPLTAYGISIENSHDSGSATSTLTGARNIEIHSSPTTTVWPTQGATYGDNTGLSLLFEGELPVHKSVDVRHVLLVKPPISFNPATGFFMCAYRGTGGYLDIVHGMGAKPMSLTLKSYTDIGTWFTYTPHWNYQQYVSWDTNTGLSAATALSLSDAPDDTLIKLGTGAAGNSVGVHYMLYAFAGETLGDLRPNMLGKRGVSVCTTINGDTTFDTGIDAVKAVIVKTLDATAAWRVYTLEGGWDKYTTLNDDQVEVSTVDVISVSGSNLTVNTSLTGDLLVIAFGETGELPVGKSLQIKASIDNPFIASIANGFKLPEGFNDVIVGYTADTSYVQTESDGDYDVVLLNTGVVDLVPKGVYTADFSTWENTELVIGECTISGDAIVSVSKLATGSSYVSSWFAVATSTTYELKNLLRTSNVKVRVEWTDDPFGDNLRRVESGYNGTVVFGYGITVDDYSIKLYTAAAYTYYDAFYVMPSPTYSSAGYYRLIVEREV